MTQLRRKALLRANLQYWLEDLLLREGLYKNVSVGEVNYNSQDISRLAPVEDPSYSTGQVWQSAFKNWVYESGISPSDTGIAPPTLASGITVNGTFYPEATTSGAFAHYIDYPNGRVVFKSPILSTSLVQGEFAFKEVTVDFADSFDNERVDLLTETAYKDNPQQTGVQIYPDKRSRTLPAVWIDILRRDNTGHELGSKSLISDFTGIFHVWGRDTYLRDIIEDILGDAERDVILGLNFNNAPYPLLSKGRRNPAFTSYSQMVNQCTTILPQYFWRRIYLESVEPEKDSSLFEIERTRVNFVARIYPVY